MNESQEKIDYIKEIYHKYEHEHEEQDGFDEEMKNVFWSVIKKIAKG